MDNFGSGGRDLRPADGAVDFGSAENKPEGAQSVNDRKNTGVGRPTMAAEEFVSEIKPFGGPTEAGQIEQARQTDQIEQIGQSERTEDNQRGLGEKAVASKGLFNEAPAPEVQGALPDENAGVLENPEMDLPNAPGMNTDISIEKTALRPLAADGSTEKKMEKQIKKSGFWSIVNDYDKKRTEEVAEKLHSLLDKGDISGAVILKNNEVRKTMLEYGRIFGDDGNEEFYETKEPAKIEKIDTGRMSEVNTEADRGANMGGSIAA